MANRGERKRQKSISAPKVRHFNRKENTFTPRSKPGPHNKEMSVPLSFCVKFILGIAKYSKETKNLIASGKIKVNGKVRKSLSFPVGVFDVVEITEPKMFFRMLLDKKGRLKMKEIEEKSASFKVCKVAGKKVVKGGKVLLVTSEGFTIDAGKEKVNVEDSIKVSLPDMKFEAVYPMEVGSTAIIVGGVHVGQLAKVESIVPGTMNREKLVTLEAKNSKYQTISDYVFIVGKAKPEIEVFEE
jgi:small subunit ribosomal protein S4e